MKNFTLEEVLIEWATKAGTCYWTIGDAVKGTQIFGGTGSGKTTGSGRMVALKYLFAGFGGLVITVKPDEKELWVKYCEEAGRSKDLLIIEPGGDKYFDFLDYEGKTGLTENIVQVLKTVIRASDEKDSGKSDDPFWETSLDMLIFHVIDLCKLAYGRVSVRLMYDIVQNLPKLDSNNAEKENQNAFVKAFQEAQLNVTTQVEVWENSKKSEDIKRMINDGSYEDAIVNAVEDARTLKFLDQFFLNTFMHLSEKTRSIVEFSFSGFLFRLLREPVYSLFCRHASNFSPDDCLNGKIIVINLPVKLYHKVGRDSQIMFKYIWQRAMEKRDIKQNNRPVFLWADEAQNFLHEHDVHCQETARSSRIATVYITQNLPNYLSNMGGNKAHENVDSFLGTLCTKIFHANADIKTNKYASELIGDVAYEETSKSSSLSGQPSFSDTRSYRIDRAVRPENFVNLKTGGESNNFKVQGYLHIQGNSIKGGLNHIKLQFDQNFKL